ncbi:MAG: hypothetical protein ACYDHG_11565 [Desulfomonilaceae bacterium]
MKRFVFVVVCALALLSAPAVGLPQGMAGPQPGQDTGSWIQSFNGVSSTIGKAKVESCLKIGVMGLTCHFDLPIASVPPYFYSGIVFPSPVQFDLKKQTLWVGAIENEVQLPQKFSLFLNGEGSAQKAVPVTMAQDPFYGDSAYPPDPVVWNGSKTQWWEIEGGLLYNFTSSFSFILGLRFDQLSLQLNDPIDQIGLYQYYLQYGYHDLYTSDMNVKTWIPYLGLRLKGANYKSDLLYGPFCSTRVALPFRYRYDLADVAPFGGPFAFQQESYSMNKPGTFLEWTFLYNAAMANNLGLDLWAEARYLSARGTGAEDSTRTYGFQYSDTWAGTSSANAQGALTTYSLAGGVAVNLEF